MIGRADLYRRVDVRFAACVVDDAVHDRETQPSADALWFRRKEWVKGTIANTRDHPDTIVRDP